MNGIRKGHIAKQTCNVGEGNILARSRYHCCREKISIHILYVSVPSVIQHG